MHLGVLPTINVFLFWPYLIVVCTSALSNNGIALAVLVLWIPLYLFLDEAEGAALEALEAREGQESCHNNRGNPKDAELNPV